MAKKTAHQIWEGLKEQNLSKEELRKVLITEGVIVKKRNKNDELIELLKKDFSGSRDYISGVNDGMYHLLQKLEQHNENP